MVDQLYRNPHLLSVPANVGGRPTEDLRAEYGLADMVQLGSNENAFGPSPLAVAAFQTAANDAHRYPGTGDRDLRRKLAARFSAGETVSLDASNFVTGNGLSDVLRMIAHAFLFDRGESIYCSPTFPLYGIFTRMFGATAIAVPHDQFRYNLRGIIDAITSETRVIFVCNPNNPTGTLVTRAEVTAFMAGVPPSVVVIFDESYYDFVQDPAYTDSIDYVRRGQDNVLVLRSFSKVYGLANLRIGYAIGTHPMIEYLTRARIVYNTSDAVLRAASAALDDQTHVQRTRQLLALEREYLYEAFAALHLNFIPTEANFVLLVDLPMDVGTMDCELLRRGIIVRPMGGFGMPSAIRVTIGTHVENEKLIAALRQLVPG